MTYTEKGKNPRGVKTRICKERVSHVIRAIDGVDSCIKRLSSANEIDKDEIVKMLIKLRKELCKI